jgi:hypothetical protein
MLYKVIGITGRAGAGKDTVYNIFKDEFAGYPVNRLAFADLLKDSAMAALGLDKDAANLFKEEATILIDVAGAEYQLSGREYLQRYGAEAHREIFGKDFWVDAAFNRLEKGVTIVTDVRFDNEAEAIHDVGGVIWRIERPGNGITESQHSSEQGVNDNLIDQLLVNDGSIADLRTRALWAWGDYQEYPNYFPWDHNPKKSAAVEQDKYTQEELAHSYLKRKEIAELFNVPIETLT